MTAKKSSNQAIRADGGMFVTQSSGKESDHSQLSFMPAGGEGKVVDDDVKSPGGLALSPDQSLLYVNDSRSHWVYSYQVQADGSLRFKQRFDDLFVPDAADDTAAGGMCVDRDGRLYVATRSGVQMCDQAGRVMAIIPVPGGAVSDVWFGGANLDQLVAMCGNQLFGRQLKTKGCLPTEPIKPAAPKL